MKLPCAVLVAITSSSGIPACGYSTQIPPSQAPGDLSTVPDTSIGTTAPLQIPFVLETRLRARRKHNNQTTTLDDLRTGDTVLDGDQLQILVQTSRDAHLYLAFCSPRGTDRRYPGLAIFPDSGSIRIAAGTTVVAPDPNASIVLDAQPGRETLYLVFSLEEISSTDTGLASAIATARRGREHADCSSIQGALRQPSKGASSIRAEKPRLGPTGAARKPVVEIERGADIVWNDGASVGIAADSDGVAVLRYELQHIPAPRRRDRR